MTIQEGRIQYLEGLVAELKKELDELKKKPAISVDKIEYKFDQLKVESLEGTLNIGLNPADLQGIDNFEVGNGIGNMKGNGPNQMPVDPKSQFRNTIEMEDEIYQHLETDLPQLIQNAETRVNRKLGDNYTDFIKEDIKKQIPARIQHYLQHTTFRGNETEKDAWKQNIIGQILKEMENGICTFLTNLPTNIKEE